LNTEFPLVEASAARLPQKGELRFKDHSPSAFPRIAVPTAVVHEWLSVRSGSEKVTAQLLALLEQPQVFATVDFMDATDRRKVMGEALPKTTFIQHLPWAKRHFRYYLPLFPFAVRTHRLASYPLILSSSHAFAHGVPKRKGQLHLCYSHTPMRYIWDMEDLYLETHNLNSGLVKHAGKLFSALLRWWDKRVSRHPDYYIANSRFTATRIRKFYGREAVVIYPPVDVNRFDVAAEKGDYYVTASRLVSYKKTELIVEAFTKMPQKKLVVIGTGKDQLRLKAMAGTNITFHDHLPFDQYHAYLKGAKAFVYAGKEDFGITMVEAQACGTPIVAFGKGGAAEIVVDGVTGILFRHQTAEALQHAIQRFESQEIPFTPALIRENAERFGVERFNQEMLAFIHNCLNERGHG
jgi:glycosyltransferase involved in cell wall biosynthesis